MVRTRRARLFAATGGLIVSVIVQVVSGYVTESSLLGLHWNATVLNWLIYFWIGVICADFQQDFKLPFWTASILGGAGLAVLEFDGYFFHDHDYVVLRTVIECLAVLLVFGSVLSPRSAPRRVCLSPWIYITGGACYSIYLTHLQVIQILTKICYSPLARNPEVIQLGVQELISIGAAGVAGGLFYMCIERPTMEPDWPTKLSARLSAAFRSPK